VFSLLFLQNKNADKAVKTATGKTVTANDTQALERVVKGAAVGPTKMNKNADKAVKTAIEKTVAAKTTTVKSVASERRQ